MPTDTLYRNIDPTFYHMIAMINANSKFSSQRETVTVMQVIHHNESKSILRSPSFLVGRRGISDVNSFVHIQVDL